jgi:alkanesulfonate monooxygenase SsuD/methylene tetrahydromethanopterin reductase-like flavin-dependent oxidoreductase (luciferase family)
MPWPECDDPVAWPYSEDEYDAEIGNRLYNNYLEQFELAEEVGFDMVAFNEHHYSGYGIAPSPNLIAANLIERTDDIRIGILGNILPIRENPIRVAEEVAMLDSMSGGRIFSGFVRGIPSEYVAYGINPDESRARLDEAWDLITQAWTADDQFDFEGEFYEYENVYIWPRPYQEPHPPLWMSAESQKSLEYAVDRGVPIGQIFVGTDNVATTFGEYRRLSKEKHGFTPPEDYFTPARFIYVGETMEKAREEAEEHLHYFYHYLQSASYRSGAVKAVGDTEYREENAFAYEQKMPDKGQKAMNFDFEEFLESGEIIVGDPEYVTSEIESQYETMGGFGTLIGLFQFGTLPDKYARKNIRMFGEEVLPEIRDLGDNGELSEFADRQYELAFD